MPDNRLKDYKVDVECAFFEKTKEIYNTMKATPLKYKDVEDKLEYAQQQAYSFYKQDFEAIDNKKIATFSAVPKYQLAFTTYANRLSNDKKKKG